MNAPIYLTEEDVRRLLTVKDALEALEECFAHWGDPDTSNIDRHRARVGAGNFNLMGAAYGHKKVSPANPGRGITRCCIPPTPRGCSP